MKLVVIPKEFTDLAWEQGASALKRATDCIDEITDSQLKTLCFQGHRTLLRMDIDDDCVGWAAVRVDQLPNIRVLHVCEMTAKSDVYYKFIDEIKVLAKSIGCSRVRCSCKPAQARLFKKQCQFKPVYETLEVIVLTI